ncbi:fimbrial protein [Acinetobacter sp. V91_7]|uniref:fimbrial protein n=1 Tax=unclassified Acinetobacter TaxID=196816 RepID=UPI00287BCF72|nr:MULTISPECIES: fimbrial protein [unclassified Acinetobacter]MDS7927988.1 fimbrial protein [Acinetobacter sp. V102_4]MDS7932492.1 fimbrial protein [Acinetobacter sp. V91_4B]MDS7961460.1 fimbrial protein [Acinetobacter sp. V91_7]MDS8025967.1 fimbrial protein [Acinetobacter sp. V91_13]
MKRILLTGALFTAGLGVYGEANASCTASNSNSGASFSTIDIPMAVGRVVVRPSDAVGKILVKSTFPITANGSRYRCTSSSDSLIATLTQGYPLSPLGNSIYSTNIPGIGIRLYREALDNANFSGYYPYTRSITVNANHVLSSGYFVVEIVKTAEQTGSGTLVPGLYSRYYATGHSANPFLTSTVYGNAITIASSSCELQGDINKAIQLPTVTKSGFTGVGSTQGEQTFDINILCNGGENPTGYEEKNLISLSYDFTQDGTNDQVLSNIAPTTDSASGVGVQLLWNYQGANQVIKKGDKLALGTLSSNQTLQYNVPMTARYYQTAANVTAGKVRAMATVTIEYD